jgi:hypothetical protein
VAGFCVQITDIPVPQNVGNSLTDKLLASQTDSAASPPYFKTTTLWKLCIFPSSAYSIE